MAISGVNSANNNNAYYVGGAAATGALAGGLTGWYSKPFLKNGAPTDAFLKKIEKDAVEVYEKNVPEDVKSSLRQASGAIDQLNSFDSVADLKNAIYTPYAEILDAIPEDDFELFKQSLVYSNEEAEKINLNLIDETYAKEVEDANSIADIKKAFKSALDRALEDKTIDDLKAEINAGMKEQADASKKAFLNQVFDSVWDSDKKKFVKAEENPLSEFVSKVAKGIQGKYAAIYGAIGAGVLGLGTYLFVGNKNNNKEA